MDLPVAAITVKDPVCGVDVTPGIARSWDYIYEAVVYNFCGSECRSQFKTDPSGILKTALSSTKAGAPTSSGEEKKSWGSQMGQLIKKWRAQLF